MSDDFKVVILAVFDDNNFPNKAMADIHGKPMIQHVYEIAEKSGASDIVIATDSTRVGMEAEEFGATVCMIVDEGNTGINRLAEVVDKMDWRDDAIVVNFPADAPLTPASLIQQVAENLESQPDVDCCLLFTKSSLEQAENEESIKLVTDSAEKVMYLSRKPLPFQANGGDEVNVYNCCIDLTAYRAGLLRIYRNLSDSELERAENIEAMKLLYNGIGIYAVEAVDTIGQRVFNEDNLNKVKFLVDPNC